MRLFTRHGFDWTDRYPRISQAVAALTALQAGLAIFDKLHSRANDGEVSLYAFDLLDDEIMPDAVKLTYIPAPDPGSAQ